MTLQAYQRHLLQVGYADRLLGDLLERLRDTGMYDRSLVVVTADHGMSFREGESGRVASQANLEDIAFVPLFVKQPGQERGEVVDHHVETIDVLPTIAEVLGFRIPWGSTAGTRWRIPGAGRSASARAAEPDGEASAPLAELALGRRSRRAEGGAVRRGSVGAPVRGRPAPGAPRPPGRRARRGIPATAPRSTTS